MALRKVSGALLIDTKNPDVALEPTLRRRQPNESPSRTAGRRALPLVEPWEPSLKTARCTVYPFRKIVSTWSPTARVPLEVQQRTAQTTGPVQLPLQPRRGLLPALPSSGDRAGRGRARAVGPDEEWRPRYTIKWESKAHERSRLEKGYVLLGAQHTQDGGRRLRRLRLRL